MSLKNYIQEHKSRIDGLLQNILSQTSLPDSRLGEAMIYSVLNGGKRLRPILAIASAEALLADSSDANIPACALELMHSYSLVHDDLPAMDDDALRRGKPTCHVQFDEATAILVGDALQSLAFELIATHQEGFNVSEGIRMKMIRCLSRASGWKGMVAGQSIDVSVMGSNISLPVLENMHALKTGALIEASVTLGALSTGLASDEELLVLKQFAAKLGLAFQIRDDILDETAGVDVLGKHSGRDAALNKPTYVSLLGIDEAEKKCDVLVDQSISLISALPDPKWLIELARYIGQRDY